MMLILLLSLAQATPLLIIEFNKAGLATPPLQLSGEPPGVLTNEGRAAKEYQGRLMQEVFSEYVPKEYNSSQFMFRTYKDDLYVQSTAAYIKGLLPDHKFKISNVRAERREEDAVLSPRDSCPRIDWLAERDQMTSSKFTNLLDYLDPFDEVLVNLTGSHGFEAAVRLGESLNSLQQRNMTLPELPRDLGKLAHRAYTMQLSQLYYGTEEAVRLGAFPLLDEVVKLIVGVAHNRTQVKVAVITTDDSTFSALLRALEMHNYVPGGDSHLIITVEQSYYLRFFYNQQEREFRLCQQPCVIQHFYQAVADATFKSKDEWSSACKAIGDEETGWSVAHLVGVGVGAMLLLWWVCSKQTIDQDKKNQ
jgi:hypothetical protein